MDQVAVSFLVTNDYNAHMNATSGQAALVQARQGQCVMLGGRKLRIETTDLIISEQTGAMQLDVVCTKLN